MTKTIIRRTPANISFDNNLPPILQKIYAARGVTSSNDLERGLENLLPHHTLMGIESAVQCLANALREQKRILVIGDFDVDGATSSALAVSALRTLGFQHVDYLVPNRFEYGYGLTPEILHVAKTKNPDLLITVDNGISSCEGVSVAKSLGMQVVITDHHLAGDVLPDADAIVNPNQPGDTFQSKYLAGVGVTFYVMLALRTHLREMNWFQNNAQPEPNLGQFLDLVALGTVADVVPLDKNNRILVYQGLQRIRSGQCRLGIQALLQVAGRQRARLSASDLGFAVAPRLNAAGRLDDMSLGIECLLANNETYAKECAEKLDQLNQERRVIEQEMQQQALAELNRLNLTSDKTTLAMGLCLFDETWHQGVIGILASRIKERLNRPVIIFAKANETEIKGSARSIPGLHVRDTLDVIAKRYPHLINKFGGHALAAGLSLNKENYAAFSKAFDEVVREQLSEEHLQEKIHSDGELTNAELTLPTAELLRNAGPWGQAFPEPLFDGQFQVVQQRLVGGKHLKMVLEIAQQWIDAIAFNVDTDIWPNHRVQQVKTAYRLDINEYRGQRTVQLIVEYLEAM